MKTRRLGVIGGCEARTQCRVRSWKLRARPRTTHRAAERGQAMECFVSLGAQTNPPAGSLHGSEKKRRKCASFVPHAKRAQSAFSGSESHRSRTANACSLASRLFLERQLARRMLGQVDQRLGGEERSDRDNGRHENGDREQAIEHR